MIWLRFGVALFPFDSMIFTLLFVAGSVVVLAFFHIIAWGIDHVFPQRIADAFYPITMKIERGLLFLFFLAIIDALLYELVFQAEKTLGLIYSLSAFFVCVAASLILGILSKDPHWIMLNHTTFSQQEVEIREGDTMRFINPASGAPQRLCLDPERGSHQLRGSGVIIAPGQALHALFPNVGDYRVTSVENPEMVLRIRVSEPPPWHEPGI